MRVAVALIALLHFLVLGPAAFGDEAVSAGASRSRSLKQAPEFVRRTGTLLTLGGKPFYFVGFNAYWLSDKGMTEDKVLVDKFMDLAKAHGMTVGRIWGFGYKLPQAPGVYNEEDFKHIDYVLHAARQRGIRIQIALGNFWKAYKGPEEWLSWATDTPLASLNQQGAPDVVNFYSNPRAMELYRANMRTWVNRVNTYSNVVYKDDPTIMAWDVMNEPRCPGCNATELQIHLRWLDSMATYLRSLDPNHLITVGSEGFFAPDDERRVYNPGAGSQCEGEDWMKKSALQNVDVALLHIYERQVEALPHPDINQPSIYCSRDFSCIMNWGKQYLKIHVDLAEQELRKPVIIQETGVTLQTWTMVERKAWMKMMLDEMITYQQQGRPLMGIMFWNVVLCDIKYNQGYDLFLDPCNKDEASKQPPRTVPTTGAAGRKLAGSFDLDMTTTAAAGDLLQSPRRTLMDETLGFFRKEGPRNTCGETNFRLWRNRWNTSGVVDMAQYMAATNRTTDEAIITDAARRMGVASGAGSRCSVIPPLVLLAVFLMIHASLF